MFQNIHQGTLNGFRLDFFLDVNSIACAPFIYFLKTMRARAFCRSGKSELFAAKKVSHLMDSWVQYVGGWRIILLQNVAVCCSLLQCVAVCCSMLQCVTVCCSVLHYVAVRVAVCMVIFSEKQAQTGWRAATLFVSRSLATATCLLHGTCLVNTHTYTTDTYNTHTYMAHTRISRKYHCRKRKKMFYM